MVKHVIIVDKKKQSFNHRILEFRLEIDSCVLNDKGKGKRF